MVQKGKGKVAIREGTLIDKGPFLKNSQCQQRVLLLSKISFLFCFFFRYANKEDLV